MLVLLYCLLRRRIIGFYSKAALPNAPKPPKKNASENGAMNNRGINTPPISYPSLVPGLLTAYIAPCEKKYCPVATAPHIINAARPHRIIKSTTPTTIFDAMIFLPFITCYEIKGVSFTHSSLIKTTLISLMRHAGNFKI